MSADTPEIERGKRAYSVQSMSTRTKSASPTSAQTLRDKKLRPKYLGRKPLIGIEEADRWFRITPRRKTRI